MVYTGKSTGPAVSGLYLERTWDDIACKPQHCLNLGGELWVLHHHLLVPPSKLPQHSEGADSSRGEIGASISKLWGGHLLGCSCGGIPLRWTFPLGVTCSVSVLQIGERS